MVAASSTEVMVDGENDDPKRIKQQSKPSNSNGETVGKKKKFEFDCREMLRQ